MRDYSEGKIYQIKNTIDDDIYVGSTCSSLEKRLVSHKYDAKRQITLSPLYNKMNEMGSDKFYIELIQDYPCQSKAELHAKEGEYIRERGSINKRVAGRTPSLYKEEFKQKLRERDSELHLCECGMFYTRHHKSSHFKSQWHHKQIEKMNDPRYVKCECGMLIVKERMHDHLRRNLHKNQMERKEEYRNED